MKKSNLKKMLAIVLCLMICASAMTLFASADTATAPTFAKTVYVSSTGNDDNDGLTEQTAVKSIDVATLKLEMLGGEIIVLDDVTYNFDATTGGHYWYYLAVNNKTVYIHGKKQADNTYPRINFQTTNQNLIMDLSSPLAIYDLELEVTMGKGLVFSGNGYPLTIGENITCVNAGSAAEATAGTHSKFMLFGGQFNAGSSAPMNLQPKAMVNIMSGDWETVYGDGNAAGTLVNTEINLLGGHVYNLMSMHPEKGTTGNGVCNIYGGTVDTYKGHAIRDNQFDIANFYNGAESGVTSMTNSFAENATFVNAGVINKLTGTAPTLFQLADYDFTPEPPTFDDENGENGDDGEFEEEEIPSGSNTEKPETNTPETNAPATNAPETNTDTTEESGCGSVIGAGALVIAAVLGTAVAVGKKKEQ